MTPTSRSCANPSDTYTLEPIALKAKIAAVLTGSDRRSIGSSNDVVQLVVKNPKRFSELISSHWHQDPIVCIRAADAAEKVSRQNPRLLARYKSQLLGLLAETEQIELRWHLAQMIPRLTLTPAERQRAATSLRRYVDDRSSIVRTFALQGLVDLSRDDAALLHETKQLLDAALLSGTPAMKACARKLLKNLHPWIKRSLRNPHLSLQSGTQS